MRVLQYYKQGRNSTNTWHKCIHIRQCSKWREVLRHQLWSPLWLCGAYFSWFVSINLLLTDLNRSSSAWNASPELFWRILLCQNQGFLYNYLYSHSFQFNLLDGCKTLFFGLTTFALNSNNTEFSPDPHKYTTLSQNWNSWFKDPS